jgi:DNA-binding response OmpR family regulator
MIATLSDTTPASRPIRATWRGLPPYMRVLYIAPRERTGGWLVDAFAADSASKVILEEAVGTVAGLARLRDEVFDAVLVSHEPGVLDALDMVEGYRAGGAEEPIVVLGALGEQEMAALCYEVGADGYVCVHATTRNLIWVVARAVQRHQMVRENQQLTVAEQARQQREQNEVARVLEQQRVLVNEACEMPQLPAELTAHYRELLRTYIIMGSGNMADELKRLAELLIAGGLTARQTMQLHLHALEELVQGLGTRSARHMMTRADLLVLELLLHLADGYRNRRIVD